MVGLNLHPLSYSTHYVKLYPQNGERIVTIDAVTSFHPMYFYKGWKKQSFKKKKFLRF